MRCANCNKVVGLEEADPEVQELEVDSEGVVHATVRIVNTCAECGADLTEATLELENDHSDKVKAHQCSKENLKNDMPPERGNTKLKLPERFGGMDHIHMLATPHTVKAVSGKEFTYVATCKQHSIVSMTQEELDEGGCPFCFRESLGADDLQMPGYWHVAPMRPTTKEVPHPKTGEKVPMQFVARCLKHNKHLTRLMLASGGCDLCDTKVRQKIEKENKVAEADDEIIMEVEEVSSERISRTEGKGRGTKTFYGAKVEYEAHCLGCSQVLIKGEFEGEEQASSMECVQ